MKTSNAQRPTSNVQLQTAAYAVLFLDNLEIQHCEHQRELTIAGGPRPAAILRRVERKGRQVWTIRNINYRDKV